MIEPKHELQRIEYEKRTWDSKFIRELEIWEAIAQGINGAKKDSSIEKHWIAVMDLYHKKYKK